MRTALFGGTFDPPHRGHLAIARAAADAFSLDRILFAPAAVQPLKPNAATASFADRLAMVTLAIATDPRFAASSLDAPRPDASPNFTVDTLSTLADDLSATHGPAAQLFCITGADAFLDLPRWREPERLLTLAQWIVVSRPGFTLPARLAAFAGRVHILDDVHIPVSATTLRSALALGQPTPDLAPAVAAYIRSHHLYTMN